MNEEPGGEPDPRGGILEIGLPNGLTSIHRRIHYATTQAAEPLSEMDRFAVETFLDVLAEIAMAVATRKLRAEAQEIE